MLHRLAPSPVVALNRAVAVAMADGPDPGLRLVDQLADDEGLQRLQGLLGRHALQLCHVGLGRQQREQFLAQRRVPFAQGLCKRVSLGPRLLQHLGQQPFDVLPASPCVGFDRHAHCSMAALTVSGWRSPAEMLPLSFSACISASDWR